MNEREFGIKAKEKCEWDLLQCLKEAFEEVVRTSGPEFYDKDVARTIELAGRLAAKATGTSPTEELIRVGKPGARETVLADRIAERYESRIKELREEVLGGDQPLDEEKVWDWIEEELGREQSDYARLTEEEKISSRLRDDYKAPALRFFGDSQASGERRVVRVEPTHCESPLWRLAWEVEILFLKTGLDREVITHWILTSAQPSIPRYKIVRHHRFVGLDLDKKVAWVSLELRAPDITWDELWGVYKRIRGMSHTRRQKPSARDARIYEWSR